MANWRIFDEHGVEADRNLPGPYYNSEAFYERWIGFRCSTTYWRPTYFAARMARGWRVFELDVGVVDFVRESQLTDWWKPASPDQLRFDTIHAVRAYLRLRGSG